VPKFFCFKSCFIFYFDQWSLISWFHPRYGGFYEYLIEDEIGTRGVTRNGTKDFMDNFNVLVEIFVVTWARKFGETKIPTMKYLLIVCPFVTEKKGISFISNFIINTCRTNKELHRKIIQHLQHCFKFFHEFVF
jgi:hypothetical protein